MFTWNTTTHNNNRFMAVCLGLPGWAGNRRNTHHPPSWSSSNLYHLLPSTMIHIILPVQITCFAIFLQNLLTWKTAFEMVHVTMHVT